MDEVRQKVINRLATLKEVEFAKPNAMDLHGPRSMMGRVQRQEDRLYKQRVLKQQKALKLKLAKIDKYRSDLQTEKERRSKLWADYQKVVEPDYPAPVFQPLSSVIPRPMIRVPMKPIRRMQRVKRRRLRHLRGE